MSNQFLVAFYFFSVFQDSAVSQDVKVLCRDHLFKTL